MDSNTSGKGQSLVTESNQFLDSYQRMLKDNQQVSYDAIDVYMIN